MIHGEPVDAKRLYSAVVSPEAGLAKIILAKIKEAGRRIKRLPWKWATRKPGCFYLAVLNSWRTAAEAVFCQLLPAMPGHSIPGNLPD